MSRVKNKRVMRPMGLLMLIGMMSLVVLGSCRKDDLPEEAAQWKVAWSSGGELEELGVHGRYYSLYTTMTGSPDSVLTLSTDADWLRLMTETLPADGIIQLLAEANEDGEGRTATITVASAKKPEQQVTLTVRQRGLSDARENNEDSDPLSDYRVGWGFDAFDEYKSLKSQRGKIIDAARLGAFDSDTTFNSLQEVVRASETFNVMSAYSLEEMSRKLTKEMTTQVNVLFVKKTVRRYSEVNTESVRESACSYTRLQKTVSMRSMDEGAVRYLVSEKDVNHMPFTDEFRKAYLAITSSEGSERMQHIVDLIDNFGTHLIISASVGCKLDLCLTFDKSSDYEFEKEVEETSKKVFGRSSHSTNTRVSEHLTCDMSNSNSMQISGGAPILRDRLLTAIKTLTDVKTLDGDMVLEWMNSVSAKDLDDVQRRKHLDVVDFRFMPIWDLFSDASARADILSYILTRSERSDCGFTDRELGTDNYHFDLSDPNLAKFGTADNASLVRVARYNGTPLMEICQEYVPKIRSDRRVTVYYPILEGRTRIGQGIFPGDGDNPPSTLTFSDGDVYVSIIEGYGIGAILTDLYYVHGNLYPESMGIGMQEVQLTTNNEVFRIVNFSTPIVKIGSGYWTRQNIQEASAFGRQQRFQGSIYSDIFYNDDSFYRQYHPGVFDNEEDELAGKAKYWYFPKTSDVLQLKSYIGNNTKALFHGQPSGFDAQFVGYIGWFDDLNGGQMASTQSIFYKDKCSFIVAKDNQQSGTALVLKPDYTLTPYALSAERQNMYPIRAFRTSYYRYK